MLDAGCATCGASRFGAVILRTVVIEILVFDEEVAFWAASADLSTVDGSTSLRNRNRERESKRLPGKYLSGSVRVNQRVVTCGARWAPSSRGGRDGGPGDLGNETGLQWLESGRRAAAS